MNPIDKLKLSIFEASADQLIDKDLTSDMLSFCESANLENEDDVKMLVEMTQTLINISESVNDCVSDTAVVEEGVQEEPELLNGEHVEESSERDIAAIKLEIFESEMSGEITKEERDELLGMLYK